MYVFKLNLCIPSGALELHLESTDLFGTYLLGPPFWICCAALSHHSPPPHPINCTSVNLSTPTSLESLYLFSMQASSLISVSINTRINSNPKAPYYSALISDQLSSFTHRVLLRLPALTVNKVLHFYLPVT